MAASENFKKSLTRRRPSVNVAAVSQKAAASLVRIDDRRTERAVVAPPGARFLSNRSGVFSVAPAVFLLPGLSPAAVEVPKPMRVRAHGAEEEEGRWRAVGSSGSATVKAMGLSSGMMAKTSLCITQRLRAKGFAR